MIDAPLALHQSTVPADWLDYNGHMTESCYLLLVGNAADAFFRYVGIDEAYRAAGRSLYTAETHLHHLREAALGDRLGVPLQLLDVGPQSLHLFHTVRNEVTREDVATAGQAVEYGEERRQGVVMEFGHNEEQRAVVATMRDFIRSELVPHEDLVER